MDEKEAPLLTHLGELRTCLVNASIGLMMGMTVCYIFSEHLMEFLRKPMMDIMPHGSSFVVLSPQEYFFTELKASLFFGVIIASPRLFFQLWSFVAPGLYKNEQTMVFWFVITASICFLAGVLFAYFLVFPPAFKFFLETLPKGIVGAYSIDMLYGFAITVFY